MVMMSYTAKDRGQLVQWKQMNTTDSSILAEQHLYISGLQLKFLVSTVVSDNVLPVFCNLEF